MKIGGNSRKREIGGRDGEPPELPETGVIKVMDLESLNYFFCLEIQASTNPEERPQDA